MLFAGVLWLIVYNINNPLESRNVEVDIVFLNEASLAANNLKVTNDYRRQVTAQISGRKSQLDQTLQRDLRAMADFSTVTNEGTEFIRVESIQYLGEQNIRYVIREDDRINLVVEKIVTGDYPIRIEATGQPEEQYHLVGITVRPENYSVKETDSLIGRIDHAVVRVDLEGNKGNSTRRIYTEIYGKDGRIINELSNYFIVDVTIEVAKEVPVIPSTIGSLPADHVVVSLMAIPEKILVSGPASELGPLESVRTENIDLGGQTEPFSATVRLTTIPQNSRVVGRSDIMEVSVYVEKLAERTFTFTRNEIEVRYADTTGTYSYVITEPTISFVLKGRRLHVNEIEKSQLNPYIDVAGMKDETRLIPVRISVPENTLQVNYP
ncbi:MAG: CdaR family protein, partial [Bacteroidales bacterium]